MLPNFLVIGSIRCATTWIHDNVRKHPDVFIPRVKELHFFDHDYAKGIECYESQFKDWSGQTAVGEITPNYLSGTWSSNPRIPESIHEHLPNVKLIAILRNPVERAYSHYWHNVADDARNLKRTFEEKLEHRPQIIEEGFYAAHLTRYLSLFDRRQMLILLYDDVERNPRELLRQIYEFIGVDPSFASGVEFLKRNSAAGHGNLARSSLLWMAQRVFSRVGWYALSERLRLANGGGAVPPMRDDTRERLLQLYRSSNDRLSTLIGRDLRSWNEGRGSQPAGPAFDRSPDGSEVILSQPTNN